MSVQTEDTACWLSGKQTRGRCCASISAMGKPLEFLRDAQSILVMCECRQPAVPRTDYDSEGKNVHVGDLAGGDLTTLIEGADEASTWA